jgi:predicted benzoate:H+ symporter BenE
MKPELRYAAAIFLPGGYLLTGWLHGEFNHMLFAIAILVLIAMATYDLHRFDK